MEQLAAHYAITCPDCGGIDHRATQNLSGQAANEDPFTKIINDLARQIYDGKTTGGEIPQALYEHTADTLMKAIFEGIGNPPKGGFHYDDPNNSLVPYLRQNMYSFSAAKSLTQMKVFNELLVGDDGIAKPFAQFRNDVAATGVLFNRNRLQTEYDTAQASAQMAQKWDDFADDEILQYSTVHDAHVRPEHAILDGITAPKTDKIWLKIWPPLAWNCRCTIIPGIAANVRKHDRDQLVKEAKISKQFQNNSGKTKTTFTKDGPYYTNTFGQDKQLKAEVNYGMDSVDQLYAENNFIASKKAKDYHEANQWWQDNNGGNLKDALILTDKLGTAIEFPDKFRVHAMEHNPDNRYEMLPNLKDMLADPDEIWSIHENNKLTTRYIKYYEDAPYTVVLVDQKPEMFYKYARKGKINYQSVNEDRAGTLLFRKK